MSGAAWLILPTYNEAENVEALVTSALVQLGKESDAPRVLVVDDNSPDGTGEIADRLAAQHLGRVDVLHRPGKGGLGPAYLAGFERALAGGAALVAVMDCDLSHDPRSLPDLIAAAERGADLVIGSRFVRGGRTVGWPRWRKVQSYAALLPTRLLLRLPVVDVTGGFKLWRADALRRIEVGTTVSQGFVFQIETTQRAARAGLRVVEVPITFREREVGVSKLSPAVKREGIVVVLRLARRPWRPTP